MTKKLKWFIKQNRSDSLSDDQINSWTITTNPKFCGWNTDSGCDGYGLPKELAQWIVDKLNETDEPSPYITKYDRFWSKVNGKKDKE